MPEAPLHKDRVGHDPTVSGGAKDRAIKGQGGCPGGRSRGCYKAEVL